MSSLRWCVLLILILVPTASTAEPLYEQFRPVTSPPWTEPGANNETVIARIYREPSLLARTALLEAYLSKVPASSFPRIFDHCLRLEEDDSPDELLELLFRHWAEKDPATAWSRCEAWFDLIIPETPLGVDSWETGIIVLNPQAAAGSSYWPGSDGFAKAFSAGVAQSSLAETEKERFITRQVEKSKAWWAAYEAAEEKTPYRGVITKSTQSPPPPELLAAQDEWAKRRKEKALEEEEQRKLLMDFLSCPPMEIEARLKATPPGRWDETILARAMLRWMDGDPKRAPGIVEFVLQAHDPKGVFREISKREPIPIEFLLEWALLDRKGFMDWAVIEPDGRQMGRPGVSSKSFAVLNAFACRDDSEPWAEDNLPMYGSEEEAWPMAMNWACIDPETALPWIWSCGERFSFEDAVLESVDRSPEVGSNVLRAIFLTLDEYAVPIPADTLSNIMEEWSGVDAAACARHGVRWNLRTRIFSKQRMIRLWSGKEDPYDGTVDDRYFGSLRIWASRKPEEARKWIRTEPLDNDAREALLWLVDHAKAGTVLPRYDSPSREP